MTSPLKAILEEMGGSGVEFGVSGVEFTYGGKVVSIVGACEDHECPKYAGIMVDITEAGG